MSELIECIRTYSVDRLDKIKEFLQNGVDQSSLNKALTVACRRDNTEIIQELIKYGAYIEYGYQGAFDKTIHFYTDEVIEHLISIKMGVVKEILKIIIDYDKLDYFKFFYNKIPDVQLSQVWLHACRYGSTKNVGYLLDLLPADFDIVNLDLYNIIGSDDNDVVLFKKILNRVSDENKFVDVRYLKSACYFSSYEIVKIILELGIDPNSENPVGIPLEYYQKYTVFECVTYSDNPSIEIVKLLLDYDANTTGICLNNILANGLDFFKLIYQTGNWTLEQKSNALYETISGEIDDEVWKFLQGEIGFELGTNYLTKIISECIYWKKYSIFEYFANFYGKDTLFDLVPFADLVNRLLREDKNGPFKYLLKFYGKETIINLVDYDNCNRRTKKYLEKFN